MEKGAKGAERQELSPVSGISGKEDGAYAQDASAPLGEAADQKKKSRIKGENRPAD